MKAIQVIKYAHRLRVQQFEIPELTKDTQLLVKVKYAPIHPADIYYSKGTYGIKLPLPAPVGMEGVGLVVEGNNQMKGKYVSFLPSEGSQFGMEFQNYKIIKGSWSQYTIVDQNDCIEIPEKLVKYGATALINPMTSLGFAHLAMNGNFKSILFSSCSSAISKMSLKLLEQKFPENKVYALKREDQAEVPFSKNLTAITVDEDLIKKITSLIDERTIFFDSFGGPTGGMILSALPDGSKLVSYGSSSMQHIAKINPQDLIFKNKCIEGFWMYKFYHHLHQEDKYYNAHRNKFFEIIRPNLTEDKIFYTNILKVFKLDQIEEAIVAHTQSKGDGKILLEM